MTTRIFRKAIRLMMLCILPVLAYSQTTPSKINVLIVDGFSNHNWKQTSLMTKTILEESGLFHVDVTTTPSIPQAEAWSSWRPRFCNYDLIIQNTNNINQKEMYWPIEVQKELEDFVKAGGGLYILHSANNAFSDWDEYNRMIGLGWRSKDEGEAIVVNDDETLRRIPIGEGEATFHGPRNDEVIHVLGNHPITNGYPKAWKTPDMELYKYARGPARNLTVLSYAQDDETGVNWPVEWVVQYGKGRVYNSSLGHLWEGDSYPVGFRCVGFQTSMIRAAEWLATGKVSYPIPDNFPSADKIKLN